MLRYRSSLERHFTPKASVICFPSVKGRFCSPSVPIYRSSGSNPWRGNKQAAGIRQSLFYSMVGRQGFSLLRRRPLRRFRALRAALANAHAFTQLRAPTGSNPWRGHKKAAGIRQSLFYSMVGRQGFSLLRRRPLRRFRALRAALANAHAFTQLRAPTGSNPCTGNKKATNRSRSLSILWWAVRGSNPGPWD